MKKEKRNIGVVTFPISAAGNTPLSNLIDILRPLSDNIYVIKGNEATVLSNKDGGKIYLFRIDHKSGTTVFTRMMRYVYTQLRISYKLATLAKNFDICIFLFGEGLVLPMIITKFLRKKSILVFTGSAAKVGEVQGDPLAKVINFSQNINYALSDTIIIYTKRIIVEHYLENYKNKCYIAHEHFLDFNNFKIKRNFDERKNLVGYIGRLTKAKGVMNFVKAIPEIMKKRDHLEFLIGGKGQLRNNIDAYLDENNLNSKVKCIGWIPHNELPDYFNALKLVVLPSYTEALPNIMLEAMACGTPVLATSVGAIPDVIKESETGFLFNSNDPRHITERIVELFDKPELLNKVSFNAHRYIKENFSYEKTLGTWKGIFGKI